MNIPVFGLDVFNGPRFLFWGEHLRVARLGHTVKSSLDPEETAEWLSKGMYPSTFGPAVGIFIDGLILSGF